MNFDLLIPGELLTALLPDLVLMGGAIVLMLWAAWKPESLQHQRSVGIGSMVLVVATIGAVLYMAGRGDTSTAGVIAVDPFRWAVDLVILLATLGTLALSIEHNERDGVPQAEMHVLVLLAASGMMILAAGRDLMIVFLGIEIMSVATYVLAGLNRRSPRAAEASLKYFLLGAFATGFMLYGIALIYGATGATQFTAIARTVSSYSLFGDPMQLIGIGLLTIGLGFKVAAVPFHMWAPDVYDGAPTPITGFMASAVKAAAFATIARIWYECFQHSLFSWGPVLWWLAAATMIIGNVVALAQQNLKRMLAYSSIAHTGYLLVAVLANSQIASAALVFYLIAYSVATLGAFAVLSAVHAGGERQPTLSDLTGLWQTRPWLAAAMAVFVLALLGFPVFGGVGFFAKWYLIRAALTSLVSLTPLVVILVLTSVVSAGYYLQVVRVMFMQSPVEGATPVPSVGPLTRAVLVVSTAFILGFGLLPSALTAWSVRGAMELHDDLPRLTDARSGGTASGR
jgi:NADH-quinone oxidoreductase subunit N